MNQIESLSGLVERVTYHNLETGYCVLKIKHDKHKDLITIVGHANTISAGEFIQSSGNWINDKNYGPQFKASFLKACPPNTEEGVEKYLGSGLIKGVGKVYAKKLVEAFQMDVFNIIEHEPAKLRMVSGIGEHRAQLIVKGWQDQKAVREIMLFLYQNGISTARAVRIYKTYGDHAIRIISENPYCLARDIRGIGFKSADTIAQKIGIPKDSPVRARAGLSHILLEATEQGHCGLPKEELIQNVINALDIPLEIVLQALDNELKTHQIILEDVESTSCVFLKGFYKAEIGIASMMKNLRQGKPPWEIEKIDEAIAWIQNKRDIQLATSQIEALKKTLQSKVMIITGGPGVGKTTLIKSFISIVEAKKIQITLCAPTGRAAKRLSDTTEREAKTIHRLLETDPTTQSFKKNQDSPLKCDLLIVDEVSMIDVTLMNALLKAIPLHAALVLVGDVDQLPSVGAGDVFKSILDSERFSTARLTEIFRQSEHSMITVNAHRINHGIMPLDYQKQNSDFFFVSATDPEDCKTKIIEIVKTRIPQRFGLNPVRDIQVLCPMNRGAVGARSFNIALQKELNASKEPTVERFGMTYGIGDKVMQLSNNYDKDVYNGDIGYIRSIDTEAQEVTIRFYNENVVYEFGELDEITLAFATTIHKSQGSEYPVIVIPVMMQHFPMLKRNLIYTGITRGKSLVVLVGEKKALAMAVKDKNSKKRWTTLRKWLT